VEATSPWNLISVIDALGADWEGYKTTCPTEVEKLAAEDSCVSARRSEGKGKGDRNLRCSQRKGKKRWECQKKSCRNSGGSRMQLSLSALDPHG
jgi:hypothetical protein